MAGYWDEGAIRLRSGTRLMSLIIERMSICCLYGVSLGLFQEICMQILHAIQDSRTDHRIPLNYVSMRMVFLYGVLYIV